MKDEKEDSKADGPQRKRTSVNKAAANFLVQTYKNYLERQKEILDAPLASERIQ